MDIKRHFNRKKVIQTNLGTYDLTLCRWKSVSATSSRRKDMCNLTTQGYIHGAAQLKDTVYTIVGPDENHSHNSMHSFNFRNCEWRKWSDCDLPSDRDSFGLITHLNQLYLFGGSNEIQQFGDTYVYSTFSSKWTKIDEGKQLARNPMVFVDVNNEFILLYGGVDIEKGEILNDAYILIERQWKQVSLSNEPKNLTGAKAVACKGKIFLFGGEIQNQGQQPIPNKTLYQLTFNNQSQTLNFQEVLLSNNIKPCPRTSHSIVALNSQNFMMIGGISLEGKNKGQIMRDMWLFNSEEVSWTRIDPANGILRGFCDSSLCLHNNKLHIIGGLVETLDTWNQQVSIVEFGQDETIRNEICSNCQQRASARDKEQKLFPKTVVVTVGFFYNISLEIRHPFQAIAAIHNCATYLQANKFRFSIERGLNDNEYILMNWDGRSLTKTQFQQFICHTNSKDQQFVKFINMLKISSLRLGKTLLFITTDKFCRKVFLFSADSKVCPEFDESYSYFAYIENLELGGIESHEGRSHQKVILNLLRSRLANAQEVLKSVTGNQLYIFEKNILVTSEKIYYYELIVSNTDDVTVFRNTKKIQFLEEIGYSLSKEPQISLKSFVSFINIDSLSPRFFIGSQQQSIDSEKYLLKLADLELAGAVSRIEVAEGSEDLQYEAWLYKAEVQRLFSHNQGVMVYYQGRLINRLDCNFGDFFKQKFYKTKYKSAETIFQILGVINVKRGLDLNYLETWFKKKRNYYQFIDNIRSSIRKVKGNKGEDEQKLISQQDRRPAKLK